MMDIGRYQPRPKTIRYIAGYLAMFLGSLVTRTKVTGRQFIPKSGPFIIVSNHFSVLDPVFVIASIRRPINFLMASDQELEMDLSWAPWLYGFIPTNRSKLAPSTIKQSLKVLRKGEILGIFPEATSLSDELRTAKDGAAYLSVATNVPVLPVGIHGTANLWTNLFHGVRQTVTVNIGRPFGPFKFSTGDRKDKQKALKIVGLEIMCRIGALLPVEQRGVVINEDRVLKYQAENNRLSGKIS